MMDSNIIESCGKTLSSLLPNDEIRFSLKDYTIFSLFKEAHLLHTNFFDKITEMHIVFMKVILLKSQSKAAKPSRRPV